MLYVIFDMDGTLLDTQQGYIPAWEYGGNCQGIPNMGRCIYDVCGMNEPSWVQYLKDHMPTLDIPKFKEDVTAYVEAHRELRLKPGATELIRFLAAHNVPMAVASSSSHAEIVHHLSAVMDIQVFDLIIGGDEVAHGKPAPDIFCRAVERLNATVEECVVFEDSPNGVRAACAAGIRCIGVPDIRPFDATVKALLYRECGTLAEAIPILETALV